MKIYEKRVAPQDYPFSIVSEVCDYFLITRFMPSTI